MKHLPAFQQNSVCASICMNKNVTVPCFPLLPNDGSPAAWGSDLRNHNPKVKMLCQTFSFKASGY